MLRRACRLVALALSLQVLVAAAAWVQFSESATSATATASNPTWIVPPPAPPISGEQLSVYDPLRARLLVVVRDTNRPRIWTRGTAPGSDWSFLATTNDAPLIGVSRVILDTARDRLLVLSFPGGAIWSLPLSGAPTWTEVLTSGFPPGLFRQSIIYDSQRDRLVAFAGHNGNCTFPDCPAKVWTLSLSGPLTWEELTVQGPAPASRNEHFATYDVVDDRMIVYGGNGCCSGAFDDLWSLSFADPPTWSQAQVVGPGPGARGSASVAYDSARRRILLFGGWNGSAHDDLWALSLTGAASWTLLDGGGAVLGPRQGAGCAYDCDADRLFVVGGYDGTTTHNDLWSFPLNLTGWQNLEPSTAWPDARHTHSAVFDVARGRFLISGGFVNFPEAMDVWSLTIGAAASWTRFSPSGEAPPGRYGHGAVYDPTGDHMLIFGGAASGPRNDVWRLSFSGGTPTWSMLSPLGAAPSPRTESAVVFDPARRRMLVIGGWDGSISTNDVWALSLDATPTWTELSPSGSPPPSRFGHSAVYDPARDRIVIFGGTADAFRYGMSDTWELLLGPTPEWRQLVVSAPAARYHHAAVCDVAEDRLVIYGGTGERPVRFYADIWALPFGGGDWTQLVANNGGPGLLELAPGVYDPTSGRMILFGGNSGGAPSRELWALDLGNHRADRGYVLAHW
jgi:galactose oxidase-like protein/Kelch motif protein